MQTRLLYTALCLLAIAGSATAETSWRAFHALKLYESDAVIEGAEVYTAAGHFLVAPPKSDAVFVLSPREFTVHRVERTKVSDVTSVDLAEKETFVLVGVLEKRGAVLAWKSGDTRYKLSAKPPLLGRVSLDELRKHTAKYEADIEAYSPDGGSVEALAKVSEPLDVVVGFGTWCPICAEWLPKFIKTIEVAGNSKISLSFISINEDLDRPADLMKTYGIDSVPTFIVSRDGKELGRVTQDWLDEEPEAVLEKRIVEILGDG